MTPPLTRIRTTDYHTAGEPFRIVRAGEGDVPALEGSTVAERRIAAMRSAAERGGTPATRALTIDEVRRALCHEPRGHTDMYGGFVVPADDDGADFGVVFWHKDGYSTACGHGTIALGVWAVEEGLVAVPEVPPGRPVDVDVTIDVPSGRVVARVHVLDGAVRSVSFVNVRSSVCALDVPLTTSRGDALADISFGGAMYAQVRAADFGLSVEPRHYRALVDLGREIKWLLDEHPAAQHPDDPRLSGVYGTMLVDDLGEYAGVDHGGARVRGPHQRNLVVFADGQADRSPCGSGTAARCATLRARGIMGPDATLRHDSIVGSTFFATATDTDAGVGAHEGAGVLPIVTGTAARTGDHQFLIRPDDEFKTGFLLP